MISENTIISYFYENFVFFATIALLASLITRFWFMLLGYPNPDVPKGISGQEVFYKDMIFSFIGIAFARLKSKFNNMNPNPFKILVCETCFNVWVCFGLCVLAELNSVYFYIIVPAISYTFQSILNRYVDINE